MKGLVEVRKLAVLTQALLRPSKVLKKEEEAEVCL
jgi:hypothetical protein